MYRFASVETEKTKHAFVVSVCLCLCVPGAAVSTKYLSTNKQKMFLLRYHHCKPEMKWKIGSLYKISRFNSLRSRNEQKYLLIRYSSVSSKKSDKFPILLVYYYFFSRMINFRMKFIFFKFGALFHLRCFLINSQDWNVAGSLTLTTVKKK